MLKIGVSACMMYPDSTRSVFGPKTLLYLEKDMANYLFRKDILPILIPELNNDEIFFHLLNQMDGFIFQGGADVAPESYNEKPIGRWKGDRDRDFYEIKILKYAIDNDKPVLAICRGMQLLNVFCGGSLYQDIETQIKTNVEHRNAKNYDTIAHEITFTGESFLQKTYKYSDKHHVNTIHHQCIKRLGYGLEVLARSREDGIVEAISLGDRKHPRIFGVQWHPEFGHSLGGLVLDGAPIYDYFLSCCI